MINRYRIILADGHMMLRQGLRRMLDGRTDLEVVGEAGDGQELFKILNKLTAHMIILDVSMSHLRGIEAIPDIRRVHPEVKILTLTVHKEEGYLQRAITAGADGCLLKEDAEAELFSAIAGIQRGRVYISPRLTDPSMPDWIRMRRGQANHPLAPSLTLREREILKLIAEGKSNREIGDLQGISIRTVERHRANMMFKLKVKSTADLAQYAVRKHMI